jgi:4-alpha-glucanotransferase
LGRVPRGVVAGLNTHDMFPFAGFLRGDDIVARRETGQVDGEGARRELAARRTLVARLGASLSEGSSRDGHPIDPEAELLRNALVYLAASSAAVVIINLDDLLGEARPQNLPGTGAERANWRRKVAASEAEVQRAIIEGTRILAGVSGSPATT